MSLGIHMAQQNSSKLETMLARTFFMQKKPN